MMIGTPAGLAKPGRSDLLPAAAVFGIVWVLTQGMRPSERESLRIIGGGMGGAVALLVAWYYTRFKHHCTYVGEGGAGLFELRGSRDRTPSTKVLRFADAADLRASQTRQFINGVYAGTVYDFRWTDAAGRERLRLKGLTAARTARPSPATRSTSQPPPKSPGACTISREPKSNWKGRVRSPSASTPRASGWSAWAPASSSSTSATARSA